jgi:hypothetical protein
MELSDETGVLGSGSAAGGVNRASEGAGGRNLTARKLRDRALSCRSCLLVWRYAVCGMRDGGAMAATAVIGPGLLPKGAPLGLHAEYKSSRPEAWERQRPTWPYLLSRLHATWTAVNERLAWE